MHEDLIYKNKTILIEVRAIFHDDLLSTIKIIGDVITIKLITNI